MGNCCGGSTNEGEISITKKGPETLKHFLDDTPGSKLKGTDKVLLIIRLQALFRGFLTRRRIR
jgi:hypothetical protein